MVGQGNALEASDRADTRVVDPDVDAAEPIECGLGQSLDVRAPGNVRGYRDGASARGVAFHRQLLEQLAAAGGKHEARAFGREAARRSLAEAARSTGDDDDPAVQLGIH